MKQTYFWQIFSVIFPYFRFRFILKRENMVAGKLLFSFICDICEKIEIEKRFNETKMRMKSDEKREKKNQK